MTGQELQSWRNIGNDSEAAADEIARLRAELAEWHKLRDPVILHVNLMRGMPARLDRATFLHLAGGAPPFEQEVGRLDAKDAEIERRRAALAESCDEHRSEIYDTATGGGCILLRDAVAAERERGDSLRSQTLDLAMMVGRLIRRIRAARAGKGIEAGDDALELECLGYLRRKGLTSPLRQEPPSGGDMTAILEVKRREWETLSPEAQAKLRAMTGDPGPEYRRQQALGAERARKAPLGGPNTKLTGASPV